MNESSGDRIDVAQRTAQLEAILENAVDAIITINESGVIESVNQATERIFGYQSEEIRGQSIKQLMPAPYRDEHDGYIARYLETGQRKIIGTGREVVGQRKDGTTFPMHLAVSEAWVSGKRLFTGIIRDLTPLHEIQQSETNLGRIIEDSLNEIYIFDAQTWRFVQVNRGARENLDFTLSELREMTPLDIKPQMTAESFAALIRPLKQGLVPKTQFTTVHQRKDGSLYPVEVHLQQSTYQGKAVFVAFIVDISERMRAEELMRVQQRAIEAASSGIVITDPNLPDNPIVICNAAFEEITGYTAEEVIGKNCRLLQGDDRDQPAIVQLREAVAAGTDCRVTLRNYRKDGKMFWNDLRISPVQDASGRVTHFVGIVSDVTDRQQKQDALRETIEEKSEQLREAESELVRQARLATLGQVFGGIAHEIRNPLNALRTSAYYLLNAKQPSPDKVNEHLQRIDRQVSIIDNIVTALSDVATLPDPNLDPVPLRDWLVPAVREVFVAPTIEVVIDLADNLPPVPVDVNQLPIALKNLIRNARDAMPDGGKITVSARADGDIVRITVADTGIGIEDNLLSRVMEPLFSTKPRGMGLGLSISRAIIEKNKGQITVASSPGSGTVFTIEFRVTESAT